MELLSSPLAMDTHLYLEGIPLSHLLQVAMHLLQEDMHLHRGAMLLLHHLQTVLILMHHLQWMHMDLLPSPWGIRMLRIQVWKWCDDVWWGLLSISCKNVDAVVRFIVVLSPSRVLTLAKSVMVLVTPVCLSSCSWTAGRRWECSM